MREKRRGGERANRDKKNPREPREGKRSWGKGRQALGLERSGVRSRVRIAERSLRDSES